MTAANPLDLRTLNLDEALGALAAGVPLESTGGEPFLLTERGRGALLFYAARQRLWRDGAQNMGMSEVEELLAWMDRAHPAVSRAPATRDRERRVLDLISVEIHHWGGLHAHCLDDGRPPEPIRLALDGGLTAVKGRNGAGKTTLANAIRWVLTGQVAGAQGGPRDEPARSAPRFIEEPASNAGFALSPITPIPSATELARLGGTPLTETRVVLTFREPDGTELLVERRLTPEGRTRFSSTTSPVEGPAHALGISSRAIEVSSLLFARLAHLELGKRNPLGEAVAALTGLQPLEELGRRSTRTASYLKKEATARIRKDQEAFASALREEKARLRQLAADHPELRLPLLPTEPIDGETATACRSELASLREGLENARGDHLTVLAELGDIDAIRLAGAEVDELRSKVEAGLAELSPNQLKRLAPLVLMKEVAGISDDVAMAARTTCGEIRRTAEKLANQKASDEVAARRRLYALVMRWHKDAHPGSPTPNDCPICATSLDGVDDDPALGLPVHGALAEAVSDGVEAAMTGVAWATDTDLLLPDLLAPRAGSRRPRGAVA